MSMQGEPVHVGKVLSFLREWDRGDRSARGRMLSSFLGRSAGRRPDELELQFAQVASLFLARLTSWMKVSSMFGHVSGLQLKAIGVFLSAPSQDQYLGEFVDHGGVVTLLEVLTQPQSNEETKAEALCLLLAISDAGRKYKEVICQSCGAMAAAECLTHSGTGETQESAWMLLESLSHGNPKYEGEIYKGLIGHLTCTSAKAQQFVLHTLNTLQSKRETAHHSIVEPLLGVLTSPHPDVQCEAARLIFELRRYDVRPMLLSGLLKLLRPAKEEEQHKFHHREESEVKHPSGSLPVFVQQAVAAKLIRLLAEDSPDISHELLSLGVIQHLLYAAGNREYTDAQVQASLALKHFVCSCPSVEEHVQRVVGTNLFVAFMNKPETWCMNMDEAQAEKLRTCKKPQSQERLREHQPEDDVGTVGGQKKNDK